MNNDQPTIHDGLPLVPRTHRDTPTTVRDLPYDPRSPELEVGDRIKLRVDWPNAPREELRDVYANVVAIDGDRITARLNSNFPGAYGKFPGWATRSVITVNERDVWAFWKGEAAGA